MCRCANVPMLIRFRFICTFTFVHTLYLAYTSFIRAERISLSQHTIPFWTDLLQTSNVSFEPGDVWRKHSGYEYAVAMEELWNVAERYMEVGRRYADGGRMSEQIAG